MSATNRGASRHPSDNYPTPVEAIDAILPYVQWQNITDIHEPAAGDFRIPACIMCYTNQLIHTRWSESRLGRDFFDCELPALGWSLTITNPPYSKAQEFLKRSLLYSINCLFLLRLNFLGSQSRRAFWETHAPSRLFVLSKRPSFTGQGTDATEYAWFAWGPDYIVPPGIYVL